VAELERQHPHAPEIGELLSGEDRLNGFFVKNLENVQGDERDVIIFSIGYGPDENGKFTEQLGPLGKKGGERRLNVAITRARRRIEVVASITAGTFPGTSNSAGVRHLQRYLDYAERGVPALALDVATSDSDVESVFEEQVLQVIRRLGYEAVPQVGVAGYRIDLGVRHPKRPGEFILGVECDGAAYHSSRVARDRDRLRQEVLEGLNWRLYRIWGPSWFRDPRGEESRLAGAIAEAVSGTERKRLRAAPKPTAPQVELLEVDLAARPDWVKTYVVSDWRAPTGLEAVVHMTPIRDLAAGVERIVRDEGPMHEDVLRRRLADAFGVKKIGSRIRTAFDDAIDHALRTTLVERTERVFLRKPDSKIAVRTPDEDDDRSRRKVAEIPAVERRLALYNLVAVSRRVSRDELKAAWRTLFGWGRAGSEIEPAYERDLAHLLNDGSLLSDDGDMLALA
jgi:very-short-patch-repair endonuclease